MRGATVAVVAVAVLAAAVLVLVLSPTGPDDADGTAPIAALAEVAGTYAAVDAADAPAALVAPVVLQVADGGIFVETGCNTGRGPAHVEAGRLVVEALATTRMACVPPVAAQEQWVLEMLDSGPRLERSVAGLTLQWGDGEPYRLGFEAVDAGDGDGPAPTV